MKKRMFFSSIVLVSVLKLQGQDLPSGFKNWFSVGAELSVSKKLAFDISLLNCTNTKPYELQFLQLSLGGTYKLHKNTYLLAGVEQFHFRSGSQFELYHKLSTGIQFRRIFGVPIKNIFEVEWYFPQQKKHRIRGVYTISYALKNKVLPWHGRPFLKGQLYYYYDGVPLTYYDANREVVAHHAPNDFHRFRLTGGLVLKPAKRWSISLYYAWNKEFNTSLTENRDLNILSKNGSKIKYPFNDYSVLGLSFTHQFKLD